MDLDKFVSEIAEKHVARSLEEMSDPDKVDRWENGERADEQAAEIVTQVLSEALQVLEQKEKQDGT